AITATPKTPGGLCPWVASSNASWLTLPVPSGTGTQTIAFNATANSGTTARSATLNVAGQNIVISESGPVCDYSLRSGTASIPFGGGSSTAGVVTAVGCPWTASSNAPFVSITTGPSSSGADDVSFTVQPNTTGTDRTGTLTIAGLTFTITQAKAPCAIM